MQVNRETTLAKLAKKILIIQILNKLATTHCKGENKYSTMMDKN